MKTIEEQIADLVEHELRNANIYWQKDIVTGVQNILDDACTPRPPKAEWFGTGPGQWDAWWIESWGVLRNVRLEDDGGLEGYNEVGELVSMYYDPTCNVVPVAREGFPAPVNWKVVDQ